MFANTLKRNIAYQYILQGAIYLYPFVTLPYLTRVLDPDVFAVRAFSISVMLIVETLVNYGFGAYGTKVVAEHSNDGETIGRLMTSILALRLGLSAVGCAIVVGMSLFIPIMADNFAYMVIAYIGVCFSGMLPDFVFQGLQDMSIMTKRFIGSRAVSIVLTFLFVRGPQDIVLVAVFEALSSLIAFVWSWIEVLAKRKIRFMARELSFESLKYCFGQGTVYFMSSFSTTILNTFTTVMIGLMITDDAQISFWSLSISVVGAVQAMYSPFTNSLYPHVVASHDLREVKKTLLVGIPIVLAMSVGIWFLADMIMLVLGGSEYVIGADILRYVTPVIALSFPAVIIGFPVLGATGNINQLTLSSIASAATNIIGMLILAGCGLFSIATVAILRSVSEFVLLFFRAIFVARWKLEN